MQNKNRDNKRIEHIIEALLFLSGQGLSIDELSIKLGVDNYEISNAVVKIKNRLDKGSALTIIEPSKGFYRMTTRPEYAAEIRSMIKVEKNPTQKLSEGALETITIIAHLQPITKSELDRIRNVDCEKTISTLLKYKLISATIDPESPGNPYYFNTTALFLKSLGIKSISELPPIEKHHMDIIRTIRESSPDKNKSAQALESLGLSKDASLKEIGDKLINKDNK